MEKTNFKMVLFFIFLAILNEIVWRNFTSDQWVFFKVWIIFPLTMFFMIFFVLPLINKKLRKLNNNFNG